MLENLFIFRKIYDDGRKVSVKVHVAQWKDLQQRLPSLTNFLGTKNFESQTISGEEKEGVEIRKNLFGAQMESESCGAKLVSSEDVEEKIPTIKKNFLSY